MVLRGSKEASRLGSPEVTPDYTLPKHHSIREGDVEFLSTTRRFHAS
jgi:hypothetical protein